MRTSLTRIPHPGARRARFALALFCAALASAGLQAAPPEKVKESFLAKNGSKLEFEMVLLPGGTFKMGSPADEKGRAENEGPQREVRLDPFYLCTTEVTMALFMAYYEETGTGKKDTAEGEEAPEPAAPAKPAGVDAITGPTPVYGDLSMGFSKQHPAIGMTWHNANVFCKWLSSRTGKKYRLPTEAEWEYAARAGTTTPFGSCPSAEALPEYAWFEANANREPHEVAKKKANAWGLFDMQGNVREWVQDFYSPDAYQQAVAGNQNANPTGPKEGKINVARGGAHDSAPEELRCAARAFEEDWWRMNDPQIPKSKWWLPQMDIVGFRVARCANEKP